MDKGWTRRAAGLAGLAAGLGTGVSAAAATDPLSGPALYADLKTYFGFGEHRTGGPADLAVSAWLKRELAAAGYHVEQQDFAYPVFDLTAAAFEIGGRAVEAFPIWTPRAGEASGPLSATARPGAVLVMSFRYGTGAPLEASEVYRKPIEAAIAAGAAGVVVITENPVGELVAYNALPKAAPWAVPVLAVAARDGPAVMAAAQAGATARLKISGAMRQGTSNNVVGRRPGSGKPLVISTPKSGWFGCAGERGSGIAIWLGLARRLATAKDLNLVLVAASGHEFDGYGGHLFAQALAPSPAAARGWVHIGANVAAYDFALEDGVPTRLDHPQAARLLAVSDSLVPAARAAFAGQPSYEHPRDIDVQPAGGEITAYQRMGYKPLVGILGVHPLHHTRRDRPDVTGPELLEPVARALAAVIERM